MSETPQEKAQAWCEKHAEHKSVPGTKFVSGRLLCSRDDVVQLLQPLMAERDVLREREVDVGRVLDLLGENRADLPRLAREKMDALRAEEERLRIEAKLQHQAGLVHLARAEKAEAALRQIAAWSWDSGSTPAPEVVSRIYCEARAVLRDSAPGGKP